MFKAVKAKSVDEYIKMLEPDRKATIMFLHTFIQKISPRFRPHFAYNMLGYGSFKYKSYKKQILDWPIVALASQKNYISMYVCSIENGTYLVENNKKSLGKVSVGKSCIRFKKLEDLDLDGLTKLLKKAANKPGLIINN